MNKMIKSLMICTMVFGTVLHATEWYEEGDGGYTTSNGNIVPSNSGDYQNTNSVTYRLADADGNTVVVLEPASGNPCEDLAFTTGGDAPVYGCMDPDAPQYNPDADTDDGSCLYPGMDCCYFGFCEDAGYYNYTVDCSGLYCYDWSVYDGDGVCDSYLACDALGLSLIHI